MHSRNFLTLDILSGTIYVDNSKETQVAAQSFLCQLIFPYIDTYIMTLAYFAIPAHRTIPHEEEMAYQKIQWLIETFLNSKLKYHESCTLESIRNAVKRFTQMGVITRERVQLKRTLFQTNFKLSPKYQSDEILQKLYQQIARFSISDTKEFE